MDFGWSFSLYYGQICLELRELVAREWSATRESLRVFQGVLRKWKIPILFPCLWIYLSNARTLFPILSNNISISKFVEVFLVFDICKIIRGLLHFNNYPNFDLSVKRHPNLHELCPRTLASIYFPNNCENRSSNIADHQNKLCIPLQNSLHFLELIVRMFRNDRRSRK